MPPRASLGVSTPAKRSTITAPIIAMSGARRPENNSASVITATVAVRAACQCCCNQSTKIQSMSD